MIRHRNYVDNNYYFDGSKRIGEYQVYDDRLFQIQRQQGRQWREDRQRGWQNDHHSELGYSERYDGYNRTRGWSEGGHINRGRNLPDEYLGHVNLHSYQDGQNLTEEEKRRVREIKRKWARDVLGPDSADEEEDYREWYDDWKKRNEADEAKRVREERERIEARHAREERARFEDEGGRSPPVSRERAVLVDEYDRRTPERYPVDRHQRQRENSPLTMGTIGQYDRLPPTPPSPGSVATNYTRQQRHSTKSVFGRYGTQPPRRDSARFPSVTRSSVRHPSAGGSVRESRTKVAAARAGKPEGKVYEDQRFGRDRHRNHFERVFVLIEHPNGRTDKNVCYDLDRAIGRRFGDSVCLTEARGRTGSFEVYINGKLLYSRLKYDGYPYENDVIEAIDNVRHGRNFSEIKHSGQSRTCTIL